MGSSQRRTRVAITLVALVLFAALAAACSARATGDSAASIVPSLSSARSGGSPAAGAASCAGAGARSADDADWTRVLQALAFMQETRPTRPVVVLLGGSAARESTTDDAGWRSQIVAAGGPATLAWNMGSRNRTLAQNVAIVKRLPPGAHAIVLIGINLGAFTSAQKTASVALPSAPPISSPSLSQPHHYSTSTGILSRGKKKALVQAWIAERYAMFRRNFRTSAGVLVTLIKECKKRGYKPVLLELPRNTQIIGGSLGAPTAKFRDRCSALHKQYHVPWVSLVPAAALPNSSFYDLWHLVEPGREVWQRLLSAKTAALLKQYGYDGGGS